jgi:hypothetical protein
VQHSKHIDGRLRDAISELHDNVKGLRSLRDSYATFAHGKKEVPFQIQQQWPQWGHAKASLQAARPSAEKCKRLISEYLRENGD